MGMGPRCGILYNCIYIYMYISCAVLARSLESVCGARARVLGDRGGAGGGAARPGAGGASTHTHKRRSQILVLNTQQHNTQHAKPLMLTKAFL